MDRVAKMLKHSNDYLPNLGRNIYFKFVVTLPTIYVGCLGFSNFISLTLLQSIIIIKLYEIISVALSMNSDNQCGRKENPFCHLLIECTFFNLVN